MCWPGAAGVLKLNDRLLASGARFDRLSEMVASGALDPYAAADQLLGEETPEPG